VHRPELTRALLDRGASLQSGVFGSPVIIAVLTGQEAVALELLEKGASAASTRPDKASTLMLAAGFGAPQVIERLKPDATELARQDVDGATALIYAARRGQGATIRVLLEQGAPVDQADSHGRTPLMYAAQNGYESVVAQLLAAGARAERTDKERATALHLAARYSGNAGIAKRLLAAAGGKSTLSMRDSSGKTALSLAQSRRFAPVAAALKAAGARPEPIAALASTRQAVQRSVTVMEQGMKRFLAQSQCVSCHHQGLGLAALGQAQLKGFVVDRGVIAGNVQRITEDAKASAPLVQLSLSEPKVKELVPTAEMGGFNTALVAWGLETVKAPKTPELTAMAQYMARLQGASGHWGLALHRGPLEKSDQTITAFQLLSLQRFLSAEESGAAQAKARTWLASAPAPQTEDKATRLLGLRRCGESPAKLAKDAAALVALQSADGGWGVTPGAPSDPLSTGIALYCLRKGAELPSSHPALKRAAEYLIRTQDETGAWYLNKLVPPLNYFFDSGFPGGESQYASFGATAWAALALMEQL
jgi:Ankyrin repeats (3 copies)/Prenyltransferase and squalene oxidase repeat